MARSPGIANQELIVPSNQPVAYTRKIATGASMLLFAKITSRLLSILGNIVLARILGPASYGVYAIGWTVLRIWGLFAPLGLDKGVIRYGSKYWEKDMAKVRILVQQVLTLSIGSSLVFAFVMYSSAPWLAQSVFQEADLIPVIRWFSIAMVMFAGLKVLAATTRITHQILYSAIAEDLLQPAVNLVLILFFALAGWRLMGGVWASVISMTLAFIVALVFVLRIIPGLSLTFRQWISETTEIIAFSLSTTFVGVLGMLLIWTDRLLVGYFRPVADVGVYQAVSQLSMVFSIITSSFGTVMTPMIAELFHLDDIDHLRNLYQVSTRWAIYVSTPVFLIIIFASSDLIALAFGQEYVQGSQVLRILSLGQFVNVSTGVVAALLIMTDNQNRWLAINTCAVLLNLALGWLLIPYFGPVGAAISTTLTVSGAFLLGLLLARKKLGVWPYSARYYKWICATAVTAVILGLVYRFLPNGMLFGLVVPILCSFSCFTGMMLLLGVDREETDFIRFMKTHAMMRLKM